MISKAGVVTIFMLSLSAAPANATVYEFNDSGAVTTFEAKDYLSGIRHKTVKRLEAKLAFKKNVSYNEIIAKASKKYGVSENLIHAVIFTESSYNPDALSPKGAGGLMQLMPGTAETYGAADRFSPEENITAGTKYLKFLLDRYKGDVKLATAAYNAGEGAVDKYGDVPPYSETKAYVEKIATLLERQ